MDLKIADVLTVTYAELQRLRAIESAAREALSANDALTAALNEKPPRNGFPFRRANEAWDALRKLLEEEPKK